MSVIAPTAEVVAELHERLAVLYPSLQSAEVYRTIDFAKSKTGDYEAVVRFYHGQSTHLANFTYKELKDDKGRPFRLWCVTNDWMD